MNLMENWEAEFELVDEADDAESGLGSTLA